MPILLPHALPAVEQLNQENIFVMTHDRAAAQDIRPLEILVLNLMPTKITTETQIARLLANSPLQVNMRLLQTHSHVSRHTAGDHLQAFYTTMQDIGEQRFDGMVITGAPVETLGFESVDYWPELRSILDWSVSHVFSTLHICWGAMAGLYHHFGIDKVPLEHKLSGVYRHRVTRENNPLVRGFDEVFAAPHSRHTGLDEAALARQTQLRVLARSDEAGPYLMSTENGRQIFVMGHPEYDRLTLDAEFRRDVARDAGTALPVNYYRGDDPADEPVFSWKSHAYLLYQNWLNYYVYQNTPYDLNAIGQGK